MSSELSPPTELGLLDREGLAVAMRPLWEDAGPLVDRLVGIRVDGWTDHVDAAEAAIAGMAEQERVVLLGAHPRLGTPAAELAARSPESWREQGGDRRPEPDATSAALDRLSSAYEARFGFPFVVWVAGRPLAEIVPILEARLTRDRTTELAAGCAALVAIARDRLGHTPMERA